MTNQTPTPEQEHPGKVALAEMAACLSDNASYAALGPAIRSIAAYVSELEAVMMAADGALDADDAMHEARACAIAALKARADAAEAEVARLREALKPFVLALEQTNIGLGFDAAEKYASANMLQAHLTMKDFANARAALSLTTPDQEDQS